MARASATISALPSATIASACLGAAISPTVRVAMPASRLTFSANWTLVLATRVGRASALMPPEEMQTKSSPAAFSALAKLAASSGVNPLVAGDARAQRHARRHDRAHRPRDFERIAHARRERATITVAALVRDGREEAVQEIAVRSVQLDGVDARTDRAFG